jgi:hypothetical protein
VARKNTQAWALQIAAQKFGKAAGIKDRGPTTRSGEKLPASDADRAEYRARFLALKDVEPVKPDLYAWSADATIGEYRAAFDKWKVEWATWKREKESAQGRSYYHRYAVGVASRMFFEIKGEGDSWEGALRDAGAL